MGKGAYGTVWLVKKKNVNDLYALKLINMTLKVFHILIIILQLIKLFFLFRMTKTLQKVLNKKMIFLLF